MQLRKPNHVCKHCGVEYYACDDCDKLNHWKKVGCCFEHAELYWRKVEAARAVKIEEIIPEQIDSQSEEIEDVDE